MNEKKIWLSSPHIGNKEFQYVTEAFDTNWIAPVGPHIEKFERQLSIRMQDNFVAALSSGTSAIHLALILLGVKENDEVICSSFTFAASANPIMYLGAKPIFIDSELDTWNMCPIQLEKAIKSRIDAGKKPKAIILVHLYGMPAKMPEIISISEKYEIPIIEDAAEALGSLYNKKPLGSLTKFGVLSFNGNKIITTSGGGALVSSEKFQIEEAKFLSTQARDEAPHYQHSKIGYNYRLSNVCAAIGLGQLEVLKERVEQRRLWYQKYKELLVDIAEINFLEEPKDCFCNRWLTCITIDEKSKVNREILRQELYKDNIESRPLWKPMHMQPIFSSFMAFGGDISESLFERGLCLPSGSNMLEDDFYRVVTKIKYIFEK
ncbi:MAG: pyridoxal phosphate-dependent aminotransferase [Flavobacteriales bacterium]|nr:pyridoxal phosphate-dependent aminotransferase [Flavobacteriales bacterium]